MYTEYEATFTTIEKGKIRSILTKKGAQLIHPEFLQQRVVYALPKGHEIKGGWLRVRDEGDKITMSLKIIDGKNIEDQKEICLEVNNFQEAELFLSSLGCERKAFQESKRELWKLNDTDITIDEWPFLEPFVEIEGPSENAVKKTSEELGFEYSKALFCSVDHLYELKYNISKKQINDNTPEITFNGKNPFIP